MTTILPAAGYSSTVLAQLGSMRRDMEDLQRQFGTGQRATTYGGLGSDRWLALSFESKLDKLDATKQSNDLLSVRMNVISTTLGRVGSIGNDLKGMLDANSFIQLTDGGTDAQRNAKTALGEMVGLFNSDVGGRYVFGGKQVDKQPVENMDTILNGSGTRAGFKTVIDERKQADSGADFRGRLQLIPSGSDVTIAEDGAHPFGMKLGAVSSTLSNVTVGGPGGSPQATSISFGGQPAAGQTISLSFKLPDGTTSTIDLKAGVTGDPVTGTFAIGATPTDTANNFNALLDQQLQTKVKTELVAASAVAAGNDFFATFQGKPPQRVNGPPFATATALRDATPTDTVAWYKGDDSATGPRNDSTATVDNSVSIAYGMRANEEAFSWQTRQMAVLAAVEVPGSSATDKAINSALVSRVKQNLSTPDGVQSVATVSMEIASANTTLTHAAQRQKQLTGTYQLLVEKTEGVDPSAVAAQLLALQTQMESSYKATSILYKMTLTNYL